MISYIIFISLPLQMFTQMFKGEDNFVEKRVKRAAKRVVLQMNGSECIGEKRNLRRRRQERSA